ncbi:glycosyltransferase family 2 protein [Thermococcus waiotapuensis]|uniref:Glycosyltransferase family 2 protein n=1 Tax=Thermococcus waiotapuensis TaxID=90909 RepID=A0AAE4NXX1_9EURY|nr:glycosyltransferase family 2 protein [Thermococcus waiotapuensis]MDV3104732.1 glycosyltransferase family 2 protein [Thermococcus waiotapuensis]
MVKVSVIMPNKNKGKWLEKSITSVLNQTYDDWELIIIDDYSTDNSKEIIQRFMEQDDRIIGIFEPDRPFPLTRNIGLERASGDYILFLDSDDWINEKMLENAVNHLENDGVDAYVSSYRVIRSNGSTRDFIYTRGVYSRFDGLKGKFRFGMGNAVLKRKILDEYNIRYTPYVYSEDSYFYLFYLSVIDKVFVDDYIGFINNRMGSSVVANKNILSKERFSQIENNYRLLFLQLEKLGKTKEISLIKKHQYPGSILSHLDFVDRKHKFLYMLKYSRVIFPYLILGRASGDVLWLWSIAVDSVIPVKWFIRRVTK